MKLEQWDGVVYAPQEDSYLFVELVSHYCKNGMKLLDMGCGSGVIGISAALKGCDVTSVDLNPSALELTKKNAEANKVAVKTVFSDLFSNVDGLFDLIVFNPPYLPTGDANSRQWVGGLKGNELTLKFFRQAKAHLEPNGFMLVMISSLSRPEDVFSELKKLGFKHELVKEEGFFFERLTILKIFC